jgi:hypothetical protein
MSLDRVIRMIARVAVFASVSLGYFVNPYWYWVTAFVGLKLLVSAVTNWCPMLIVLRRFGINGSCAAAPPRRS